MKLLFEMSKKAAFVSTVSEAETKVLLVQQLSVSEWRILLNEFKANENYVVTALERDGGYEVTENKIQG